MFLRQNLSWFAARSANVFFLFQRNSPSEKFTDKTEKLDEAVDFSQIRCPLCRWQPRASSRWYCTDADFPHYFYNGCGAVWNTFDTRGRCPGCNHQWRWTDCPRCGSCSPHEAWYENKPD